MLRHHERPDGYGPPGGLARGEIPLEALIMGVAGWRTLRSAADLPEQAEAILAGLAAPRQAGGAAGEGVQCLQSGPSGEDDTRRERLGPRRRRARVGRSGPFDHQTPRLVPCARFPSLEVCRCSASPTPASALSPLLDPRHPRDRRIGHRRSRPGGAGAVSTGRPVGHSAATAPSPSCPLEALPDDSSPWAAYQRKPFAAHLAGKVTTAMPTSIASAVSLAKLRTD